MKVVAYSIKPFEKEFLSKANQKKHEITLISNPLSIETTSYAEGKDAIIVFTNDDVSAGVIEKLAGLDIKYIATRSAGTDHIDREAASRHGIKVANVPYYSPEAIAEHAVALAFALNRNLIKANEHSHHFNFTNNGLMGFNFSGKTVGIIGLGNTGLATAAIFKGLGCIVIGYDLNFPEGNNVIEQVTLPYLYANADIISLHVPLNDGTKHIINKTSLHQMKDGVMLINTSRGPLVKTTDIIQAIYTGKVGYLGLDVYEFEKGLFFEDHEKDSFKDELLEELLQFDNVLITPHQAYLTREALQGIANQTIKNLDLWQQNKCVGKACVCAKNCRAMEG
ncbi:MULTISPECIES: 2-hydroxyacid dehydrogenase [unclassified Mucilaginibacter]|uniref:2-hydroxyacid dehydrogenase n=1 Tax=unclassified Mucilaginibacter TaxID=2617802 RepID=UPI002AC999B3|nr:MULTISPECIES: 2-hydroxyacid dehydrogenase [unclassified Mucilaginibacter]MEB0260577.1 2-hydroxyacid dehydrogenase [Mucilaginibacter sp. 10I4]MEB0278067.1 2-hydroxyacid dehydrogenase [Mucilaginibacter sp. 10B2]MEB0302412.1 2-hydroxyacid dehydrogenase [Mucilaginibacter sp. 5C4]WPX22978.1 2-hydroxyacid dehydrogenase [Mucilaginibacter sp. 5C4]